MRYKVQVTEEDIKKGVQGDASACAFARSMKRSGIGNPRVTGVKWSGDIEGVRFEGKIPRTIAEWIRDFDSSKAAVRPQAFVIDFDVDEIVTDDTLEGLEGEPTPIRVAVVAEKAHAAV